MEGTLFSNTAGHKTLVELAEKQRSLHLKFQLNDNARSEQLRAVWNGIHFDFSRQKVDDKIMNALYDLASETRLKEKIDAMIRGDAVNTTENRSALHTALRLPAEKFQTLFDARSHQSVTVTELKDIPTGVPDPKKIVDDVQAVLNRIKRFSHFIRAGEWFGHTGKPLKDVICVGIGGSYLGPEFVIEALKTYKPANQACAGRRIRFLANVDPVDVARATEGFIPETTLVVIVSKTFTTAETMLNARTLKNWLLKTLETESAIAKHVCAVSTNIKLTGEFGINPDTVFGFWDWVGGRFSVTSAVGVLPLALHFGWPIVQEFMQGCHDMDSHFGSTEMKDGNLPILMGLLSFYNSTYLDYNSVAILPYAQCLHKFPAHIQQLTMESNGKTVRTSMSGSNGTVATPEGLQKGFPTGEIYFGEPGTNGQHSFYQLMHQGRIIPAEFIGFAKSQNHIHLLNEPVSNHDELMSNFFAQPDALAFGKTANELRKEGVPENLVPHKTFTGDRPSSMLLMPECSPYYIGCLLALYEHRTVVEGFLYGLNPFDQWGVELGKVLAKEVRGFLQHKRADDTEKASLIETRFCASTKHMLEVYMNLSKS